MRVRLGTPKLETEIQPVATTLLREPGQGPVTRESVSAAGVVSHRRLHRICLQRSRSPPSFQCDLETWIQLRDKADGALDPERYAAEPCRSASGAVGSCSKIATSAPLTRQQPRSSRLRESRHGENQFVSMSAYRCSR